MVWIIGATGFSFVNTVAYRFPRQKKILNEHFCCDHCGQQLKAYETIPVFSYIALKGRCRYCDEDIARRDFFNELIGGFISLLIFFRFGDMYRLSDTFRLSSPLDIVVHFDIWKLLYLLVILLFFCIMDMIILVDHDTMEIPNRFIILLLYVDVVALIVMQDIGLIEHIIGGVCISVPLFLITLAVPGAFGGGDIKLSAAVGLFLGWKLSIIGFLMGLLAAGVYAVIMLATGKKGKKEHFPFGPFLCTGYMVSAICGMNVLAMYLKLAAFLHG